MAEPSCRQQRSPRHSPYCTFPLYHRLHLPSPWNSDLSGTRPIIHDQLDPGSARTSRPVDRTDCNRSPPTLNPLLHGGLTSLLLSARLSMPGAAAVHPHLAKSEEWHSAVIALVQSARRPRSLRLSPRTNRPQRFSPAHSDVSYVQRTTYLHTEPASCKNGFYQHCWAGLLTRARPRCTVRRRGDGRRFATSSVPTNRPVARRGLFCFGLVR